MNFRIKQKNDHTRVLLEILNLADGNLDLLSIANLKILKIIDYINLVKDLLKTKYLRKMKTLVNWRSS